MGEGRNAGKGQAREEASSGHQKSRSSRAGPQATFVLNSMPRVNPEEQGRLRAQLGYFPEDLVAFGGQKGGDFSKQSFGVPSFSFLIQSRLVACTCPKDSKNAIK